MNQNYWMTQLLNEERNRELLRQAEQARLSRQFQVNAVTEQRNDLLGKLRADMAKLVSPNRENRPAVSDLNR